MIHKSNVISKPLISQLKIIQDNSNKKTSNVFFFSLMHFPFPANTIYKRLNAIIIPALILAEYISLNINDSLQYKITNIKMQFHLFNDFVTSMKSIHSLLVLLKSTRYSCKGIFHVAAFQLPFSSSQIFPYFR